MSLYTYRHKTPAALLSVVVAVSHGLDPSYSQVGRCRMCYSCSGAHKVTNWRSCLIVLSWLWITVRVMFLLYWNPQLYWRSEKTNDIYSWYRLSFDLLVRARVCMCCFLFKNFWPHNVVRRSICCQNVCPSDTPRKTALKRDTPTRKRIDTAR